MLGLITGALAPLGSIAVKAALSWLLKFATQAFFQDLIMHIIKEGAKSTKTDYDDKVVALIEKSLNNG